MFDSGWMLALSGCLVGAIVGFAARKSHFCTMAALERHWYAGDDRPLRAWALAAFTALIATQLLGAAGLTRDCSNPSIWTRPAVARRRDCRRTMFGFGHGAGRHLAASARCPARRRQSACAGGADGPRALRPLRPSAASPPISAQSCSIVVHRPVRIWRTIGRRRISRATGLNATLPLALIIERVQDCWWVFKSASFRSDRTV